MAEQLRNFLKPLPPAAQGIQPPATFNYPFHYQPHELALHAAEDLQRYLRTQTDWQHDFGPEDMTTTGSQGKMFGVLVVADRQGELGYLSAYSGKLAESNHLPGFVPPVFDLLVTDGVYRTGEKEIHAVTLEIEALENSPEYAAARNKLATIKAEGEDTLEKERALLKQGKKRRAALRAAGDSDEATLAAESIRQSYGLKDLTRAVKNSISLAEEELAVFTERLEGLKSKRASMSNDLQQWIFKQYTFLDARGEYRDLGSIFRATVFGVPPAGSGECAAPKLLQFAYRHDLQPVALAEFWWGQSPASEIRKHGRYFPACRGKCEPILGHMLNGLDVDPNPLLENPAIGKQLTTVYEDDYLMVINKPAEFLSVPGKHIEDSVWSRLRKRYPEATGPMIVHRLDMSTSGLLLVAKTKEAHKKLQHQFFKRSVEKRYVALLEGQIDGDEGIIDLPLRGDLEDRPRQIVCPEHGKAARTKWKVVERTAAGTRVQFWPVTGRTHQLRVHAAHPEGLNASIVGDDLYGVPGERLHLHAEWIKFIHPETRNEMEFSATPEF